MSVSILVTGVTAYSGRNTNVAYPSERAIKDWQDAIELLMLSLYDHRPFCPRVSDLPAPGMGTRRALLFSADHFGYADRASMSARLLDTLDRKLETETCYGSYDPSF